MFRRRNEDYYESFGALHFMIVSERRGEQARPGR